jgi:hypothetical protein
MSKIPTSSARNAVCLLAFAALVLAFTAPAAAEPAAQPTAQQDCGPSLAFLGAESPEAVLFGSPRPAPQARKKDDSIGDPGELATCIADCWDGSTVTCDGSSCSAQDSDCEDEVRGQCWGTSSGTKYCPVCEGCSAECQDGSSVTCIGSSCNATDWSCPSERGQCYGSTSGTKYCPPLDCEEPCDPTLCEDKNGTSCSGPGSSDCSFPGGGCGSCFCNGSTWNCTV